MTRYIEAPIDPPEGIVPPDGLPLFLGLPNRTADEVFMDQVADFVEDREWWLAALKAAITIHGRDDAVRAYHVDAELGRKLRLELIEMATRAGEHPHAIDTWVEEKREELG